MKNDFVIPNISAIKKGEKSNLLAAEQWKEYFLAQDVIKTVVDRSDIKKILKQGFSISEPISSVMFIVLFPKSFNHLHDFIANLTSSSAFAVFLANGNVTVMLNDQIEQMPYLKAWQTIVNRVTGTEFLKLIPEKPVGNIGELEKLKVDHGTFQQRLQSWIDAFNDIPGVRADAYNEDVPGRLIEISLNTSFPKESDNYEYWELNDSNTVSDMFSNGEHSKTYNDWRKEVVKIENLTWQDFYNHVLVLSQKYGTIPEMQTN